MIDWRYDNTRLVRVASLATLEQRLVWLKDLYYLFPGEDRWLAYNVACSRAQRSRALLNRRQSPRANPFGLDSADMALAMEHDGLEGLNRHLVRRGFSSIELTTHQERSFLRELQRLTFDLTHVDARTFLDCIENGLTVSDSIDWVESGEDPSNHGYVPLSDVPFCDACDRFGGCEQSCCTCCGICYYECQEEDHEHTCGDCGEEYCGDEHECSGGEESTYEQTGLRACLRIASSRLGDIPRLTSLEIECADLDGKARYEISRTGAGVGSDGSVVGDSTAEVRTLPFAGDPHVNHVTTIYSHLRGASVNASCGLHLHLDMRETTESQILHVCSIWAGVERAVMDATLPERRKSNVYCKPHRVRSSYPQDIMNQTDRYRTLNVFSALNDHRTIEFRLWEGTLDVERALHFARIANGVVVWGLTDGSPTLNVGRRPTRDEWLRLLAARLPTDTAELLLSGEIAKAAERECA